MAKSDKFEKAVARAEGKPEDAEQHALSVIQGDMSMEMDQIDPMELAKLVASGQMEAGQQIVELTEGMGIRGQLLGRGEPAVLDDPNRPGEMRSVPTWRMRLRSGVVCTFIGAAQLERQLPPFVGRKGETIIVRGATTKQKGKAKQLTHYMVVGPPSTAPRFDERIIDVKKGPNPQDAEDLT